MLSSLHSHLLDVLHEQGKSASNCGGNDAAGTLRCKIEKPEDNVLSTMETTKSIIKRWTTEEDLTEGTALQRKTQSLADFIGGNKNNTATKTIIIIIIIGGNAYL